LTINGKGDGDAQQIESMLEQVKSPVDKFSGGGAYDTYEVWELLKDSDIRGIIPPQENAVYWVEEYDNLLDIERNNVLRQISGDGNQAI
jgi:hypothetical protein